MTAITKRFGAVVANVDVNFSAREGEVHALIGENGAGKSTLMSILAGLFRPDAGTIAIAGQTVHFRSPRNAIEHGVGMVYQQFMLVDSFTVAENAVLGQRGMGRRIDIAAVEREFAALGDRYGLSVDPHAQVWQLSVGEQQRVEIVRLLFLGAMILIFDEPTAVLTPQESAELVRTLRAMAAEGFCIIFISHKLEEVLAVADRITVMRRGRVVATTDARQTDRSSLARLMMDRETPPAVTDGDRVPSGDTVVVVQGIHATGENGLPALKGVDLKIGAGEILGIAGVAGNGQRELAEVVTGLRRATAGDVRIDGADMTHASPRELAEAGVAHVPEDRLGTGLAAGLDVTASAILRDYRSASLSRGPFLHSAAVASFADRLIADYDIATPGRTARVSSLSGGNQQKLLLARELSGEPKLLVAVHPTRGVDVGATATIHRLILEQRARGAATLLISEDLDELLVLADRIAVLYEGRVIGTVDAAGADPARIGLMMAGVAVEGAAESVGD